MPLSPGEGFVFLGHLTGSGNRRFVECPLARVVKSVDTQDLKSCGQKWLCGFKSRPGYRPSLKRGLFLCAVCQGVILQTKIFANFSPRCMALQMSQADKILIKNMVCQRCIMTVEHILRDAGIPFRNVIMGEVALGRKLSKEETERLKTGLNNVGFELIETRLNKII